MKDVQITRRLMAKRPLLVTLSALIIAAVLACFFVLHNVPHTEELRHQGTNPRKAGVSVDLSRFRDEIARAGTVSDRYHNLIMRNGAEKNEKEHGSVSKTSGSASKKGSERSWLRKPGKREAVGDLPPPHSETISSATLARTDVTTSKIPPARVASSISPSTPTTKRDVIIGMAHDIDPKNLAVFCGSVRDKEVQPRKDIVEVIIFANQPVPALYTQIARKYDVTLVPFDLEKDFDVAYRAYHPSSLRWTLIHRYLLEEERYLHFRRIWLADARDTWFQRDPFAMLSPEEKGFFAFKGVENLQIKDCGWNGGWVKDCFGPRELTDVGDNNIICSGVSMGDAQSVMVYLRMMSSLIAGKKDKDLVSSTASDAHNNAYAKVANRGKFPVCERNGVDQGVHNVLVHEKAIPNLHIYSHKEGLVANLQAQRSTLHLSTASLYGRKLVTNGDGAPVSVVHQYDRKPDLQQILFEKYVDWVKVGDEQAEWAYESSCMRFDHKAGVDLFRKRCDLKMKGGATSSASCCKYCAETQSCSAFTYFCSVCFLKTCRGPNGAVPGSSSLAGAVSGWLK